MSLLGNLFSDDNSSSNDFMSFLRTTGDVGVDYATWNWDSEDSSDGTSGSAGHIGTNFDLGAILGGMSDSESDSDGGGLLGIL
ncbi:MAG: hypothetical protein U1E50_11225 [Caulobacteraceae bacterium]